MRGSDEVVEDVDHRFRGLDVRKVPDAGEHLESATRHSLVRGVSVRDGNDPVLVTSDQQGGQAITDVDLAERADRLPAVIDHRPQRSQKCLASRPI